MFKDSEDVLEEALTIFKKLFGEESVEVAGVLNHLFVTYLNTSQHNKSRLLKLPVITASCTSHCCFKKSFLMTWL